MLKTMGHQATEEMLQKMIRVRLTKKTNTKDKGTQTKTNTMGQQATEEMLQKIIITIHRNIAPSLAQP